MSTMSTAILAGLSSILSAASAAEDRAVIPVDSPAFVFSPANWVGDEGRGGRQFRQTWNSYAYCRIAWETKAGAPQAALLLDTSAFAAAIIPQLLRLLPAE